jgi:Tfp pilus assembly PilM family ATPase
MNWLLKNCTYPKIPILQKRETWCPIGMDMGNDCLQAAQLEIKGKAINLITGYSKERPENVEAGSAGWQRWAIESIQEMTANHNFMGKEIIAALPANEVFIDHIRVPKTSRSKPDDTIIAKLKQKLPIEPDEAMIKYIPTEGDIIMVIATEREKIDRHLAIYEKAQLSIKSIAVWPLALACSYTNFFGRRKTDIEAIVMLVDVETNCTNVVICRHKNLLLAHSIPIGANQLQDNDEITTRLVLELTGCRRRFASLYGIAQIERLIFLSGKTVERDIYTTIAKQLEMSAQMGDCLAAVEFPENAGDCGIDRRQCKVSWATAFGLGLSSLP